MRSMNPKLIVVTVLSTLAFTALVLAHGGNPHVMGTVTAIDEHRIEIKTEEGKTVSAHLTKDTKYSKGDTAVTRADVKIGMRAVLHLEGKGEHQTVHEVKLAVEK
jgi:preprotein translocase subunit YajC